MARNVGVDFKIRLSELTEVQKRYIALILPQNVYLTKHATEQATKRGFKLYSRDVLYNLKIQNVIDVQVDTTKRVKFLVRYSYDTKRDIVLAIAQNGAVCTAWLNSKNDNHATLKDKHLYTTDLKKLQGVLK